MLAARLASALASALVVVSVGWGLACTVWLRAPGYLGIQRWALGVGLVCLLMGAWTFAMFVRRNPVLSEEEAGDGQA